jgi:hypothetical protein
LRELNRDYSIFAQVVEPDLEDLTRWAAFDAAAPTSQWSPDTAQTVTFPLLLNRDTPPGVYAIIVGVYTVEDGAFTNLPLVTADGRITNETFLRLTLLRVEP